MKSTLSHDKRSDRVYLINLHRDDFPEIINYIDWLADKFQYTKIFAKVPSKYAPAFFNAGYIIEASIPLFFKGKGDVLFLMKYMTEERHIPEHDALQAFQDMLIKPATANKKPLDDIFTIRPLKVADINDMITIFKQVFKTYPFPIFEPSFLLKSMQENETRYFGVFHDHNLIAVSSAECNTADKNAEMTDFAVLPKYRGKRLAIHLLSFMEKELVRSDFKTFYTISRLKSLSMNKTFYNSGYKYSGTLIQNTQISGNIENMNVWYKNITD
ncbi:MAG: putative beta-lysine N-acetyltransferase [Bacteroidales bacterium]|nr:putative beta-lysine N-acetyltransferase [Bacteroidales bacterium]MDT8372726.1 putative beta-lysine N-acetyltransferase [Bacteroidales bacterium]